MLDIIAATGVVALCVVATGVAAVVVVTFSMTVRTCIEIVARVRR